MSQPFVLEIGVEELPASFIESALSAMPGLAREGLAHARLEHGAIRALGAPRRLALLIEDLADRQSDLSESVSGPPEKAAYEADGTPKKAAIGFAKKLGVAVEDLTIEETERGRYVMGRREEAGQEAGAVLPGILERVFSRIPFPKSMRWGTGEIAFGRPVHWVMCLHGEELVEVTLAGVAAGRDTRGHRFLAPASVEIEVASEYVDALREARVLVDPEERTRVMLERMEAAASEAGGVIVDDPFLVGENAGMVEEPHVICGSFDEAFLELPDEVTIGVMRGHQRYFALRDSEGRLLPRYIAIVNTDRAPDVITMGNDRVLRARLADGRFFVEEDRSRGLDAMVPGLDAVVYHAKLGSVGERVLRFAAVAGPMDESGVAAQAARLCKADLVSLIVGEFPELQGTMGRWYAEREELAPEICAAIEEHYLPRHAGDALPPTVASASLAVAERADALVGCFGVGLIPSGSNDPFALRRATLGMIRIALEGPIDVDARGILGAAYDAYASQDKALKPKEEVLGALLDFFRGRLESAYAAKKEHPQDAVQAALAAWPGGSIRDAAARIALCSEVGSKTEWATFREAFKRAYNIAKEAPDAEDYDVAKATEDAERALAEGWRAIEGRVVELTRAGNYREVLPLVTELRDPIHQFFAEVFVMDDDLDVRNNRLRLLGSIARTLTEIAHFHLLSPS